ncbi:hypothetical protein BD410DRAFT_727601 [Rickenella mellea]|uniref:Uncharacterized protein n=1 Tax=Rickenella mellea TaxID=50990 RepID=A0A4Y7PUL3_9AGAM|nr:hypothetical protein BD410DRAFT_727601 [Rickenella mellea]
MNSHPSSEPRSSPTTHSILRRRTETVRRRTPNSDSNLSSDLDDVSFGYEQSYAPVRHPTITTYRLLVTCITAGFGLFKVWLAYNGLSVTPTTLEWIFGVIMALALFWLGLYEEEAPKSCSWLFEKDMAFIFKDYFIFKVFLYICA